MTTKMEGQADRVQRYATTGRVLLTLSENDNIMDSQKNAKELTSMPRPKGSKNKKTAVIIETVESIDERIATTEAAISTLTEELKAKKAELKELTKAKAAAEKLAAEKKAEEDKAKLLDAIAASGKSIDEIIDMIGK
jgi:septal ring factor EnvC (AmiA/AmiB activator)